MKIFAMINPGLPERSHADGKIMAYADKIGERIGDASLNQLLTLMFFQHLFFWEYPWV